MKQADIIAKAQSVVAFAYNNKQSNWYLDHCKKHGYKKLPVVETPDDISKLPFMTRADMSGVSLFDRAFRSPAMAHEIRSTSGTTNQGALFYMRDVLYYKIVSRMHADGARRKLIFWNYHMAASYVEADRQAGVQTVVGDPHQLDRNVNLVKDLLIDTLSGTPSLLLLFGEILQPYGLNGQITFLETHGEPCSVEALQTLSNIFPNADLYAQYSMGEVGQEIGIRTPACDRQESNYYHINEADVFVEAVNEELIVTRFITPTIMPLIRYNTGDNVGWIGYDECSCGHKGLSLELLGRHNVDYVRISGVELRHELIANIVDKFQKELDGFVTTEVSEDTINNAQKITLNVYVVPRTGQKTGLDDLKQRLQKALMQSLSVSSTTTLAEMISSGMFDVPVITFLGKRPTGNKQPGIKLITHRN